MESATGAPHRRAGIVSKGTTFEWYSIATTSSDVPMLPIHERDSITKEVMCCTYPKPGVGSIDAIIDKKRLNHNPISGLGGLDLPLVHEEWLQLLPIDVVAAEVYVGKVLAADRQPVDGWVSFRPRHRTFMRGELEDVVFRRCPRCQRVQYWGNPPWYLSKHLKAGVRIFGGSIYNLIVHHSLTDKLYRRKHWKKYSIRGMTVIDPPPDGITEKFEIEF
ncbi:MAG: hypothetical protein K1X57_16275 [Gemmataceae bacterium]|nr:hypothetical protein [Gemmataceae bacterium]